MTTPIRLLPFATAGGVRNMALDDALLRSAADGVASLRFYAWDAPTLSLGYFQPSAPALAYPGLTGLPWLRRATGGAALVHHREVTYALALPATFPPPPGTTWLLAVHGAIRDALRRLGVTSELCVADDKRGDVLCFLHHTPGDILCGGNKIVGSAQRKSRGGLLQHGGILLAQSPHTPELPGVAELAGVALSPEVVADAVTAELSRTFGWIRTSGDFTAREHAAADEAASERFASAAWNGRR